MTHAEFVAAYRERRLVARVDRAAARRFVSARVLLPIVLLPVLGLSVAIALLGHYIAGGALFVAALAARYLVRATAEGFVLQRGLHDERLYRDALQAGVLRVEEPR